LAGVLAVGLLGVLVADFLVVTADAFKGSG
jgi:hypothetical protein